MGYPKLLFDNRFADAIPAASSTAAGNFNAANVADMRAYTWWKPNAMPAMLTVDCGSAKAANYALIYGHDLFTQGATLEIRASTDNFAASNVLVASITPSDNGVYLLEFATASYRWWQMKLTGAGMPSVAIAMIGNAFVMPAFLKSGFDPISPATIQQSNNNDNGQPLGKIIDYAQFKQSLVFGNVSWAWLRSTWQPAWRSNLRGSPFFLAWDSANYPTEVYLVTAGDTPKTPHAQGGLAELTFDVSGVGT